jgi:ribosome-associated translation inhibitor RaiA
MRYRFHDHGNINEPLRRVVEQKSRLLDKHLQHVQDDLKLLDVTVDHHLRSDTYTTRLVLRVLDREIAAANQAKTIPQSARGAFDDLFDQLDEFLAKLRREPEIRDERRKPAWLPEPSLPVDWEQWEEAEEPEELEGIEDLEEYAEETGMTETWRPQHGDGD